MSARVVDGRAMVPCEPLQQTLAALSTLPSGETLTLLLYREPFPLYSILDERGVPHATQLRDDGTYVIEIRPT